MLCTPESFPLQPFAGPVNFYRRASQALTDPPRLSISSGLSTDDTGLHGSSAPAEPSTQDIFKCIQGAAPSFQRLQTDSGALPSLPASCARRNLRMLRTLLEPKKMELQDSQLSKIMPGAVLPSFKQRHIPPLLDVVLLTSPKVCKTLKRWLWHDTVHSQVSCPSIIEKVRVCA